MQHLPKDEAHSPFLHVCAGEGHNLAAFSSDFGRKLSAVYPELRAWFRAVHAASRPIGGRKTPIN
jgi:hypothetical protein